MSDAPRPLRHLVYFAAAFAVIAVYYVVRGDASMVAANVLMALGFGVMSRSDRKGSGPWVWAGTAVVVAGALVMVLGDWW